jgi:hypothetical protein
MPVEATALIGALGGISEIAREAFAGRAESPRGAAGRVPTVGAGLRGDAG